LIDQNQHNLDDSFLANLCGAEKCRDSAASGECAASFAAANSMAVIAQLVPIAFLDAGKTDQQ
jgi:hypothetical protein